MPKRNRQLVNSAEARRRQGFKAAEECALLFDKMFLDFNTSDMASLRQCAESLLQCVHEYSAYQNAIAAEFESGGK